MNRKDFTDFEKKIADQLSGNPKLLEMYYTLRKTEKSRDLLLVVDSISILNYSRGSPNMCQKTNNTVTMKDLRCLERNFSGDEMEFLSQGAIEFFIWRFAHKQHHFLQPQTSLFPLNCCKINTRPEDFNVASLVHAQVDRFNFKTRRYLIFPIMYENEVYVTIAENMEHTNRKSIEHTKESSIFHVGTGSLATYEKMIVPKLDVMMEAGMGIDRTEVKLWANPPVIKSFPAVTAQEKPFVLLYFLSRLLTSHPEMPNWIRIVEEFNSNSSQFQRNLIAHRRLLCAEISKILLTGGTKEGYHLIKQKERIVKYNRKHTPQVEETSV